MSEQSPVVILGFNRPTLIARVFRAVSQARPARLYLGMDGPRAIVPSDAEKVRRTREAVSQVDWPCEVVEIFAPTNMGLKNRIVSGLTEVFRTADRAIVLEDDCVPDHTFFSYCDELLDRYSDEPTVGVISGSSRLRGQKVSPYSYDFSSDLRIWGWATWSRTWTTLVESGDLEASWSDQQQREILSRLPGGARKQSMSKMLKSAGTLDSWALPFAVHFAQRGYLSAVPHINLVENIGFGVESTHTQFEDYVSQVPAATMDLPLSHPPVIQVNPELDALESRLDAREWWLYPLRHPISVGAKFFRYALRVMSAWKGKK